MQPEITQTATIVIEDSRNLLQLRDNKPFFFFPWYWGLFGGGVQEGEQPNDALRRELKEEPGLTFAWLRSLTRFEFDLAPMGLSHIYREFFEMPSPVARAVVAAGRRRSV